MDNGKSVKDKNTNTEESESHRLTITRAAELALVAAVEVVNDGYTGGRINRNQLATWVLNRHGPKLSHDDIKEIRAEHLDEISAFEAYLRRAKESGKLPPELRAFIQRENGLDEVPRKKLKKPLQENVINDDNSVIADA